jgi:hypothetical protein
VHIVVVKQTDETLAEPAAGMVRRFLFEFFEGATVKDTKAWRRFWRAMNEAGSGEYFSFKLERQRQNWRHKKHMGLISKVFDSQERFTDFEQFRLWLKVGSGFVDWCAGPKGGVFPVPKSISFDQCSEDEFIEYHDNAVAFLRTEHAAKYLFPDSPIFLAEAGIEKILSRYERQHDEANRN